MKYQDYLDEYIKKGSFLKILNKKDIFFNDSTSIVLTAAIGLMFLLILLSLYITQISMMFGNIMLVIFLALFSLIGYLFLSSRFTKVLIAYEKENVVNWEFIIIPKEIDLTISEKHSKMIGKKLIKVLVKRNNNYFGYDPYFFNDEIPVDIINHSSYTDDVGDAHTMFGPQVWMAGDTAEVFVGYVDSIHNIEYNYSFFVILENGN